MNKTPLPRHQKEASVMTVDKYRNYPSAITEKNSELTEI